MKLITSGITRIVIATKRYAIKLPRINYAKGNAEALLTIKKMGLKLPAF